MSMLTGQSEPSAVLAGRAPRRRPSTASLVDSAVPTPRAVAAGVPVRSRQTGLIFQVLLGAAACLSLVAVVQQATSQAEEPVEGSPSSPPPSVFVETD